MASTTAPNGAGTADFPFTIDESDDNASEIEVLEAICPSRSQSTPPSPRDPDSRQAENIHIDAKSKSPSVGTARPMKRKRSDSEMSMDDQSDVDDGDGGSLPIPNPPNHGAGKSRKAKKRKMKALEKKELYLARLNRLDHNPALIPQIPPGLDPAIAATMNPFLFLPQLHRDILELDFLRIHHSNPGINSSQQIWPPQPMYGGQPHWNFQSPDISTHPASSTAVYPPPTLSQADVYTASPIPPPKPVGPIGVKPDNVPNSKHGVFKIPDTALGKDNKPYIPSPVCTLVLEQLPPQYRTVEWVSSWSWRVSEAHPVKVLIDNTGSKALVEFPTAEAAQKAWSSPKLGAANIGLKQYELKGRPRDDLIRAHWYRADGISAGAGEIEDGEIVQLPGKANGPQKRIQKKPRKQRPEKPRFLVDNGLPPRPPHPTALNGSHLPRYPSGGNNSYPSIQVNEVKDGEDMDLGSPPPTDSILANTVKPENTFFKQPLEQQKHERQGLDPESNNLAYGNLFLPSARNATPTTVAPISNEAMEASLRQRVRASKGTVPKPKASTSLPPGPVGDAGSVSTKMALDAADSLLAEMVGGTGQPPLAKAELATKQQQKAELAELAARRQELELELARLRQNPRHRQSEQQRPSSGTSSSSELIKPSAKLNLNYVPEPRLFWPGQSEQTTCIIEIPDEED